MDRLPSSFRAYRMLWIATCLAVGIAFTEAVSALPWVFWLLMTGGSAVFVILLLALRRRRMVTLRPLGFTVGLTVLFVSLGALVHRSTRALPADHFAHHLYAPAWTGGSRWMEGRVDGSVQMRDDRLRLTLELNKLTVGADTVRTAGRVRLTVMGDQLPRPVVGDTLRFNTQLRPVPLRRNPADFDYGRYLRRRGVHALATVPAEHLEIRGGERSVLSGALLHARSYVRRHLHHLIGGENARSVLLALTLGERHHLDDRVRERFVDTGLMHLLAVSGLHVLLVGMVLYQLLRPFLLRLGLPWAVMEIARSVATLGLLVGYLLLTGAPPSVVRAVVMAALALGSVLFQRKTHPLNLLGAAAVVLLLIRPSHLFEPGFQLSFGAVAALVLLPPVMMDALPDVLRSNVALRYLTDSIVASTAAALGTLPALLYHFGHASFAGLLLNVVAIPVTMLGLGLTLVALLVAGAFPAAAALPAAAADVLIRALLGSASIGAEWFGWAALTRHLADGWLLLALVLMLFALAALPYPRRRWLLVSGALLAASLGLWKQVHDEAFAPRLEVVFLDVGQGDASLVTLPNGRQLLVDAGPRNPYVDAGRRTLLPHLRRFGIRRLDAVVITHADSDHLGGLPALLRSVEIGRVLHNGRSHDSDLYRETMALLDSLHVPHHALHAGDTLQLDPSVRIHVLAPDTAAALSGNEASVVLRLAHGHARFLFTGDVEADAEALLTQRYTSMLASDVVKVAHHGSRTSSSPAFVEAVAPDTTGAPLAIVSVGRRNPFGLPAPDILDRWERRHSAVLTTAQEGAIWLESDGYEVQRHAWR